MKRLLFGILLMAMVAPALATNLNFQNPGDNSSIIYHVSYLPSGGSYYGGWVESAVGRNSYIISHSHAAGNLGTRSGFMLASPSATTYAAATLVSRQDSYAVPCFDLLDNTGTSMWEYHEVPPSVPTRYEMKMVGGTAYIYRGGVLLSNSTPLAQNPSYVQVGTFYSYTYNSGRSTYWDDYVYGDGENKIVLGLPETNGFIILDDVTNDAADGLYNLTSSTQQESTYMYGTFSRGNSSTEPEPLENQSVNLVNYLSGAIYETKYTGTAHTGTLTYNIKTSLIDTNAPGGWYALNIPGTSAYSNQILKRSNGASVTWDRDTYSTGDTGTVITIVADGGYWEPSIYDYKVGVMDIYGTFHGSNTTVTEQTQTITHDWSETDNPGVYYAILFATKDDGTQYIFGLDWAELDSVFSLSGYVNDAQTGLTLSGANLNFTQGATIVDTTSGIDGNYSATGFATGAPLIVNATATNYVQYVYSFTPLAAKTVSMNVSLVPASPTLSGLGIGGVARDVIYGRPIQDAFVTVTNTTTAEEYIKTTSMTGWYLCDEGSSCFLTTKRPYDIWGEKLRYDNSPNYTAVAA